ncbi:hypothetical protein ZEAMMB73_Zm00001d008401 [Zea mays]|uniref:Uncharacterized protein n=1 Tax=Zea mays TaxID=4577 RepID=A0A1D6FCJ4_MAIZE|nr:hypothetical protein ZEAMMB73_Zm00001d008401 [Zea mays]
MALIMGGFGPLYLDLQRFAAFLSPLTLGRVNIAVNSVYISKVSLAIVVRYSLSRRAFSIAPDAPESRSPPTSSSTGRLAPLSLTFH